MDGKQIISVSLMAVLILLYFFGDRIAPIVRKFWRRRGLLFCVWGGGLAGFALALALWVNGLDPGSPSYIYVVGVVFAGGAGMLSSIFAGSALAVLLEPEGGYDE